MSGLQARGEESINGVDVREQGNTLRLVTILKQGLTLEEIEPEHESYLIHLL